MSGHTSRTTQYTGAGTRRKVGDARMREELVPGDPQLWQHEFDLAAKAFTLRRERGGGRVGRMGGNGRPQQALEDESLRPSGDPGVAQAWVTLPTIPSSS